MTLGRPRAFTRTRLAVLFIALALLLALIAGAGRILVEDDPVQHADAIAVLAGSAMNRPLEAVDLYKRGEAPVIVVTREKAEEAITLLTARGIAIPSETDVTRNVMLQLGVPASAIIIPDRIHDNTAQEAQTLHVLALQHHWHTLIVVTSWYHTRRAGFAVRRELRGSGIEVVMHATRYEHVDPSRWWSTRQDMRWVLDEGAKLIAYELGLGA